MKSKLNIGEYQIYSVLGMAGVSPLERTRAQRWGRYYMVMLIVMAAILLLEWQWLLLDKLTMVQRIAINWLVWGFFFSSFIILISSVKDRQRFLLQNWLLPVAIIIGIPFVLLNQHYMNVLAPFRPILAIIILTPTFHTFFKFLLDGHLVTTLLVALVLIVIVGLLVAGVDPGIKSPWDGIWWALATVSTIGYGDVVPVSALGRLIGVGLIISGIGVFVVVTANILALVLKKEADLFKQEKFDIDQIQEDITEIKRVQQEMLQGIKSIKIKNQGNSESNDR